MLLRQRNARPGPPSKEHSDRQSILMNPASPLCAGSASEEALRTRKEAVRMGKGPSRETESAPTTRKKARLTRKKASCDEEKSVVT